MQFFKIKNNDLTVIVYNFVDMLSHSRTEMEMIKELASDDKAYRSLTVSWFKNSPLLEMIHQAQGLGFKLILTTDHGTINVKNPSKVIVMFDNDSWFDYDRIKKVVPFDVDFVILPKEKDPNDLSWSELKEIFKEIL